MRKRISILIVLLLLPVLVSGQSVRAHLGPFYGTQYGVPDTTYLKLLSADSVGSMRPIQEISTSTGVRSSGWFTYMDSTYLENGVAAFGAGTNGYQWVRSEYVASSLINVFWAGAQGDGTTDDAPAVNKCITFLKTHGGTLLFPRPPSSYFLNTAVACTTFTKTIRLQGEFGTIIKGGTSGVNRQFMFHLHEVKNDVFVDNIIFDGDSKVAQCLRIVNKTSSTHPDSIGNVIVTDCQFLNAKETDDTGVVQSIGLYIRGMFETVDISRTLIKNIYSTKSSGPICNGIYIGQEYLVNNYSSQVFITNCILDSVYNATTQDANGIFVAADADIQSNIAIINDCTFKNCKARSIKSQYQHTIVTNNHFFRNAYSGIEAEVDIQYAGGTVDNNFFYYNGYEPGNIINSTVYSLDAYQTLVSNNQVYITGVIVPHFVAVGPSLTTTAIKGLSVKNNRIFGTINYLVKARLNEVAGNYVTIMDNFVTELDSSWVKTWRNSGIGTLNIVFENNYSDSTNALLVKTTDTEVGIIAPHGPNYNAIVDLSGSAAFTTTATADTVLISTATVLDKYLLTPYGASVDSTDVLMGEAKVDTLIVHRPAGGTSGLTYHWWRFK